MPTISWQFDLTDNITAVTKTMDAALDGFDTRVHEASESLKQFTTVADTMATRLTSADRGLATLGSTVGNVGSQFRAATHEIDAFNRATAAFAQGGGAGALRGGAGRGGWGGGFDSWLDGPFKAGASNGYGPFAGPFNASSMSSGGRDASMAAQIRAADPFQDTMAAEAHSLSKLKEKTESLSTTTEETTEGMKSFGSIWLKLYVAMEAIHFAAEGVRKGMEFYSHGIEQASWKQTMMQGFEIQLGGKEMAGQFWRQLTDIERKVPFGTQDVNSAAQLLLPELGAGKSLRTIKGLSDLVLPGQGTLAQTAEEIMYSLGTGRLNQQMMKALDRQTGGVIGMVPLEKEYAREHGLTEAQARAKITTGGARGTLNLDANTALELMMNIAAERGGGVLGAVGEKRGTESFSGVLSTFKSNIDRLFQSIDISGLTKLVYNINEMLSGGLGAELSDDVNDLFRRAYENMFSQYEGPDGKIKLQHDMKSLGDAALDAAQAVVLLAEAAGWVAKSAAKGWEFITNPRDLSRRQLDENTIVGGDYMTHRFNTDSAFEMKQRIKTGDIGLPIYNGTHMDESYDVILRAYAHALADPKGFGIDKLGALQTPKIHLDSVRRLDHLQAHLRLLEQEPGNAPLRNAISIVGPDGKVVGGPEGNVLITLNYQGNGKPEDVEKAVHDGARKALSEHHSSRSRTATAYGNPKS